MVSFKSFISAIHRAISETANSLINRNEELVNRFFERTTSTEKEDGEKQILTPKVVRMAYPMLDDKGNVVKSEIQVPLITIVPVCATKIEKATLTSKFGISVADDEVQINFVDASKHKSDVAYGKLKVVISPQDAPKGLELLINGYNNILRRQIP